MAHPGHSARAFFLVAASLAAAFAVAQLRAAGAQDAAAPRDPPPPLPKEVLTDPKVIAQGKAIWDEQCSHCHGSKAYPGKAPRLTPKKYTPEFVWDRAHNGFRGMPSWKDAYTPDEIIAVVAWVMSDDFFP